MDPKQHHWLEDLASPEIRRVIDTNSAAAWARLRDPLNCLDTSGWWHRAFQAEGVPAEVHGRVGLSNRGGYLNSDGSVDNHVFLAVGRERALFDPTYAQLLNDGPWSLDRYRMEGDGRAFPDWRTEQEASEPPQRTPTTASQPDARPAILAGFVVIAALFVVVWLATRPPRT